MSTTFKAYAPATISNVGSGFDLLGLCLEHPGDHVYARFSDIPGVSIHSIRGFKTGISKESNSALHAVQTMLEDLQIEENIELIIEKGYRHSSGLGSSAASAVAALIAVNTLLGKPLKQKTDLYPYALAGERHQDPQLPADNVAACLLGGIVLSHPNRPPVILPVPDGLHITVVRTNTSIQTTTERTGLPTNVPLKDTIQQTYSIANLILGLYRSNLDMIQIGLKDHLIEKFRSSNIPNFQNVKQIAQEEGALGCTISGSGPAVFALSPNSLIAENIKDRWSELFSDLSDEDLFISRINMTGAHLC